MRAPPGPPDKHPDDWEYTPLPGDLVAVVSSVLLDEAGYWAVVVEETLTADRRPSGWYTLKRLESGAWDHAPSTRVVPAVWNFDGPVAILERA